MLKSQSLSSILLTTTLITLFLATFPIEATTTQNPEILKTKNQKKSLALSWSSISNIFSRKKSNKGSRDLRGGICPIAPEKLIDRNSSDSNEEDIQRVWSDRPLFIWQIKEGTAQKIELFIPGVEQAFWQREITPGETKILYDGEPLQPGQVYEWKLIALTPFLQESRLFNFQVMEQQQRSRITAELAKLQAQLKQKAASVETIALEKAKFFTKKELWSDALRELYSVATPSAKLTQALAQIQSNDFCQR